VKMTKNGVLWPVCVTERVTALLNGKEPSAEFRAKLFRVNDGLGWTRTSGLLLRSLS